SPSAAAEPAYARPVALTLFSLSWKPAAWASAKASTPAMPSASAVKLAERECMVGWSPWGGLHRRGRGSCGASRRAPYEAVCNGNGERSGHVREHSLAGSAGLALGHARPVHPAAGGVRRAGAGGRAGAHRAAARLGRAV